MGVINQQVSLSPVFSIKLFIFRKSVKKSLICRCTLYSYSLLSLGSRGERNPGKRKGRATPGEGEEGEGEGGEKDEEGTTRT